MTLHYHGTPITPNSVLESMAGANFCVSYAAPSQVARCHEWGQSVMLDNGAFSFWRQGKTCDKGWWEGYYDWCERWLAHPTTWAVIPDVIDGTEVEQDALIGEWPFGDRGAPVWHMHEPLERLLDLLSDWPKVCIGSSGQYADLGTRQWHHRMEWVFNAVSALYFGTNPPWLHMLRGMAQVRGPYPFASVDSTDIGRNHNRPQNQASEMMRRWDRIQCPTSWKFRQQLTIAS